jgi:hypothetical protein
MKININFSKLSKVLSLNRLILLNIYLNCSIITCYPSFKLMSNYNSIMISASHLSTLIECVQNNLQDGDILNR